MKQFLVGLVLVFAFNAQAQDRPAELMLLGVFHFANPGRDIVRVNHVDVTTPDSQAYLVGLAKRLCEFEPTVILLEFDRSREPEMQEQLDSYLAGKLSLTPNEIHQLGFRVAKECGVAKVFGIDEVEIGWDAEPLFAHLEESEPELLQAFNSAIERLQAEEAAAHNDLSLRELLIRANEPEQDRINKDLYLVTNVAGAGSNFEGADATARWWHRNFRMYANIQSHAKTGERVLVVAGQGHTAIFRDLAAIDGRILSRDIDSYL